MNLDNRKSRLLIEALTHSNWIEGEWSAEALQDSLEAWECLHGCISNRHGILTTYAILEMHNSLMETRNIEDKYKGQFRDCAVSVGGRVCPNIGKKAIEEKVVKWIEKWDIDWEIPRIEMGSYYTTQNIKKAHIAFEKIYPFVDGNGRIGRMLMFWMQLKAGLDPIVIKVEDKFEYDKWFK